MFHGRKLAASLILLFITATSFAHDVVPGEYVVKLKSGASNIQGQQLFFDKQFAIKSVLSESDNIFVVKRPVAEDSKKILQWLSSHDYVEFAEPNFIVQSQLTPNDKYYKSTWGLHNKKRPYSDIDAELAWDVTTGSKKVVVAVLDTGVDLDHDDLAENIFVNKKELHGLPGVDDDNNGFVDDVNGYDFSANDADPTDLQGHGTHVAGTIGAKGNNRIGVAGVNWDVSILPVRFLDKKGSGTTEDAYKAIMYSIKMGADIINASWGSKSFSLLLEAGIKKASQAGVLFVAAAGNNGDNLDNEKTEFFPANYEVDNVIAVAASTKKGRLASFSNYGEKTIFIAAPGAFITSTGHRGGKKTLSGTSMAAPHVAGVAALVLAQEPHLSPPQLIDRLIMTATPLDKLNRKVREGRLLNAYNAVMNLRY